MKRYLCRIKVENESMEGVEIALVVYVNADGTKSAGRKALKYIKNDKVLNQLKLGLGMVAEEFPDPKYGASNVG